MLLIINTSPNICYVPIDPATYMQVPGNKVYVVNYTFVVSLHKIARYRFCVHVLVLLITPQQTETSMSGRSPQILFGFYQKLR